MSNTTVFVAGLTGRFARLLTYHLLAKTGVQIRGTARNPTKLPSQFSSDPRITVIQGDSEDVDSIRKAMSGSSVAVCCYLGDNHLMEAGQKTLIDAAIAENVPRYIAGDWSLDFRKLKYGEHPAKDPMKRIEEYLDKKEAEGAIKGVHILNGEFMEVFRKFSGQFNGRSEPPTFKYYGDGTEPLDMTTYDDAAWFTAQVALDRTANGWYQILGDSKGIKDIASIYASVYGVEAKIERQGSLQDLAKKLEATRKAQPHNMWAWMGMNYNLKMLDGSTSLEDVQNDRYPGFKPIDVRAYLENHKREEL